MPKKSGTDADLRKLKRDVWKMKQQNDAVIRHSNLSRNRPGIVPQHTTAKRITKVVRRGTSRGPKP